MKTCLRDAIVPTIMLLGAIAFACAIALGHDGEDHGAASSSTFLRGDTTGDMQIGIDDALLTLQHLYHPNCSGYCAQAGDWDGDGQITAGDAIQCLTYLYQGGCPPKSPFPSCGTAESSLSCHAPTACGE